nr:AIF_HP1_G0030760.mRNA.1.CDS.1 [Saccharomyces cerevisiae]
MATDYHCLHFADYATDNGVHVLLPRVFFHNAIWNGPRHVVFSSGRFERKDVNTFYINGSDILCRISSYDWLSSQLLDRGTTAWVDHEDGSQVLRDGLTKTTKLWTIL